LVQDRVDEGNMTAQQRRDNRIKLKHVIQELNTIEQDMYIDEAAIVLLQDMVRIIGPVIRGELGCMINILSNESKDILKKAESLLVKVKE